MAVVCPLNISEGRRPSVLSDIAAPAGRDLLDLHSDPDHNRAVLTLLGEDAPRAVAEAAVAVLDLRTHEGVHPRIGVVDVVPFVPVGSTPLAEAIGARDRFAVWAADELGLPCFLYGPERTLPSLRREVVVPGTAAGACAVGARGPLVAYNLWLEKPDLELARGVARQLRGPAVRALGLQVGDQVQVSMNLVDPLVVGPAAVYDRVAAATAITRAELVGLIPEAVLAAVPPGRWSELDLAADRTVEARIAAR